MILAMVLLAFASWATEPYHAEVIGISDGDTIKVLHEGTQVRIRLYGIDTPEKRQAFHHGSTVNGSETREEILVAYELDPNEIVEFKELLMANTIQIDTMFQLLIQKGFFTEAEYLDKMKEVSVDYRLGDR